MPGLTGPMIGSFQSGGKISAVFFDNTILADRYGFLLQQSYGELFNDDWRFAAGLQLDVFAPGLPTVLPFSGLGGSGSAGNGIKGQIRVERFVPIHSDSQLTLQVALSEPLGTVEFPDTSLDEDNGLPNLEGRIAFWFRKPGIHRHRSADAASLGGRCFRRGRPASQDRLSTRPSATGCF